MSCDVDGAIGVDDAEQVVLQARDDRLGLTTGRQKQCQRDCGVSIDVAVTEVPVPVGVNVRGAGLAEALCGLLEHFLHLQWRQVRVRLDDQSCNAAD